MATRPDESRTAVSQRDLADTACFLDGHDRPSDRSSCDGCDDWAASAFAALEARAAAGAVEGPDPHEDSPRAEIVASALGAEWHDHLIETRTQRFVWRHRHERSAGAAPAPSVPSVALDVAAEERDDIALALRSWADDLRDPVANPRSALARRRRQKAAQISELADRIDIGPTLAAAGLRASVHSPEGTS